jgi:hypothetical protein
LSPLTQIIGALLVLTAFALTQARLLSPDARNYLILNLLGGGVLALDAYIGRQWGFLLLERVWATIAAWGLSSPRRQSANRP